MKTYLNYSQKNNNINNNLLMRKHKPTAEQKHKINTTRENTELHRPARAISFGGSAGLDKVTKLATKVFNGTVEFVNDNEAAYNAIYALIVAGIIKPLFILNSKGQEEKDKQIIATKNFLQAFLGFFLSYTIGGKFVKKAIDKVQTNFKLFDDKTGEAIKATSTKALEIAKSALEKEGNKNPTIDQITKKAQDLIENFQKNHLKAFQNNPEFVKNLKNGFENAKSGTSYLEAFNVFWKNSTGAPTVLLKAKLSSLLLPGVMAFLFAKKNLEREMQEKAKQEALTKKLTTQENQFKEMMKNKNSKVSFKGNILESAIDGTATLVEKAGLSKKFGEPVTKLVSKFKKPSARMADLESFIITGYWLQNTARSKKIEPSQKLGLNLHSALVTIVSSSCAFIIDWALDGLIDKSKNKYSAKLNNIVENVKANPNLEIGETLDSALKDVPPAIKLGIKDKVIALLNSKQTKDGLAEITNGDIESIIKQLLSENPETFKGFELDEKLITKAIESLKKSEPIRKNILEQTSNLIGSKKVAKDLAMAIGDNKAIPKAIEKLTKDYGKKLSKFKSLTIFTIVVRFLVPVKMAPYSGKLKKKVSQWMEERQAKKTQTAK